MRFLFRSAGLIEALEEEFNDWRADNHHLLDVGLSGDVLSLRSKLNAAFTKAFKSS